MRLASLVALCLASLSAQAQTPDPTPPEAYYPLGIGNVREYETSGDASPPDYFREIVRRDTVIGGRTYRLVETESFDSNGASTARSTQPLRFDEALTAVVTVALGSTSEYRVTPCRFDLPFPAPSVSVECENTLYSGEPSATVIVGGTPVETSVKVFGAIFGNTDYAAGLGVVRQEQEASDRVRRLRYARIDGVAYGTPNPLLPPLAGEDEPVGARLALTAGPNPTAGPLALRLTLPAPARLTVEAFDALGRRVHRAETAVGAGEQTLSVDAGRWAPGVYAVRVTTSGGERASVRVVRR